MNSTIPNPRTLTLSDIADLLPSADIVYANPQQVTLYFDDTRAGHRIILDYCFNRNSFNVDELEGYSTDDRGRGSWTRIERQYSVDLPNKAGMKALRQAVAKLQPAYQHSFTAYRSGDTWKTY